MPKRKTHRGAKARFKVTGSGKVMRRHRGKNHLLSKKSAARKRRLGREAEVTGGDKDKALRLLGKR